MPRAGENPLARFAYAVTHEDGYSFGTPRLSDDGSWVALPVLRVGTPARPYVLAEEVSDRLSAVDVGRIDRLRLRNDSRSRVFVPPGTVLEGRGTASRGTCAGLWLEPGATCEIRVRCIQETEPIRQGVALHLVGRLAPPPLAQALLSLDQGLVWATAEADSRAAAGRPKANGPSDDAECGRVILDAEGVVAAEILDHPDSWRALARPWTPPRGAAAGLGLNPDGAVRVACAFLGQLPRRAYHDAAPDCGVAVDASAAWAAMEGEVAHLIAFGRDLTDRGSASIPVEPPLPELETSAASLSNPASAASDETEVAVAEIAMADAAEGTDVSSPVVRPRKRKVLTSGWDPATLVSLERLSRKEFRGDRSAAIRFLVRRELGQRGYLGPHPLPPTPMAVPVLEPEEPSPQVAMGRPSAEARIHDLARVAETEAYADWLRKRARLELERIAAADSDGVLRSAARFALDGLPPEEAPEPAPEPDAIEMEGPAAPPPPPPADVRPLLRRAFAASAGGRYPEALTLFDEALLAEPDNRTALLGRAVALRRSGKAQEALDALGAVLRAEPMNAAALLNRGRILQERGDLEGALEAFDLLAQAAANDWDVWVARGEVLARLGRDRDALASYGEALRRNPDDAGIQAKIRALETARATPASAASRRVPLPRDVQEGQSYLVRERRPDLSLRMVRAFAARAVPGLIITRMPLDQVRAEAIPGARVLELSHAPGEGHHDPTALVALTKQVERFVQQNHGHGVVLLDGLGPLVLDNGFRETILFIERVHEIVLQSHALFLVSAVPGGLAEREAALLERSLRVLE